MKVDELISTSDEGEKVHFDGASIPVTVLKALLKEGYAHLRHYREEKTFSVWGNASTGCFTEEQLRKRFLEGEAAG